MISLSLSQYQRVVIAALFFLIPTVQGYGQSSTIVIDTERSTLSYTGHHRLHDWTGVSKAATGTLTVDPETPEQSRIEISAPLESFDSGNSNRDSNMLDVVDADTYKEVTFTSKSVAIENWEKTTDGYTGMWNVTGTLNFHGRTQQTLLPVNVTINKDQFEATTSFQIELDQFEVRRPKLLLMPISNTIDLSGEIRGSLNSEEQVSR